jgi:hypothetical protein
VKWSERMIARALCTQLLNRKCIVLVPNTTWTGYEADVLGVTMDLRLVDIEIKISRSDLKADAAKDKWWRRMGWSKEGPPHKLPWPRKVWKHYYCLPAEIWKSELLEALPSPKSGVLLVSPSREAPEDETRVTVQCMRRATPNRDAERLTAEQAVDVARLANLRMWEAYADLHRMKAAA